MKLPLSSQVRPTGVTLAGCCNLLLSFFPRQEDLMVSEAWSSSARPKWDGKASHALYSGEEEDQVS